MRINKSLIAGLIIVLINAFIVKSQPPAINEASRSVIDTTLDNTMLTIRSLSLHDWELADEIEVYEPINLYDKIDGRAEYYLSYDLVWAVFCSYRRNANNRFLIELTIFNMLTPINAFGVFSGERTEITSQLRFGRDSYCLGANYSIWKGPFYIQINASGTTDELHRACLELAEKLTENLNDSGQPVWGLETLPADNLVPQSIQYFLVDALGHIFLKNTFTAKYYKYNIEIPVFLSHQNSPESVIKVLSGFTNFTSKYGKGNEIISEDGIEVLICDMGEFYDIIFQKGLFIGGVTEMKDKNLGMKAAIDFCKRLHIE